MKTVRVMVGLVSLLGVLLFGLVFAATFDHGFLRDSPGLEKFLHKQGDRLIREYSAALEARRVDRREIDRELSKAALELRRKAMKEIRVFSGIGVVLFSAPLLMVLFAGVKIYRLLLSFVLLLAAVVSVAVAGSCFFGSDWLRGLGP